MNKYNIRFLLHASFCFTLSYQENGGCNIHQIQVEVEVFGLVSA
jgi:hypothetical protein